MIRAAASTSIRMQDFIPKGAPRAHIVRKYPGEGVTVVACENSVGLMIPRLILYAGIRENKAWENGLPAGPSIV